MARPIWKRPGLLLGGVTVYAGTALAAYLTFYEPKTNSIPPITHDSRLRVFNANADKYDKDVDFDETITGISLMRRFLLRSARGRVLELAAGTGRNLTYYPHDSHVTLTDFSTGMLQQITDKQKANVATCDIRVMSASELQCENDSFDTVVDTFGLCSMDEGVKALKEMQRVCKSREDGGRILLLEHGRSHYAWLSSILDKFADQHAQRWGCHWNRDILEMVKEAGLEIETLHRFHFGTTYYIIARPAGKDDHAAERDASN